MHPMTGFVFAAALVAGFAVFPRLRRWWRKGCDPCRIQDMGGNPTVVPHTCFPWKNPYRDRQGRVWEFGRLVRKPSVFRAQREKA